MYSIQKGVLPRLTGIIGLVLPIFVLLLDMDYILKNISTRIPELMGNSTKPVWLVVLMFLFVTMFFPIYFGMLLASIFPAIEIRRDGIKFTFWEFFGSKINWDEIDSLVYYTNGNIILLIDKRGFPLFNGLYFNDLLAKRFRSHLPIIILSPGLEKREEIIKEILSKCSPRIVHRKD